jgi:hypothetical protein
VNDLQQRVLECAGEYPERVEEWNAYLYFLRDYADEDGVIPRSFDALVDEVFGAIAS